MLDIDKFQNLIKQHVIAVLSTYTRTRVGTVSSYDPNTYTAKVLIQPENLQTNYLPIKVDQAGNQFGSYIGLNLGDMVVVEFQEGDFSTGIITGCLYNSVETPINPGPPSGERWFVHKTGTYLKFKNDGTVELTLLDANSNPTTFNITGNVAVTGNITSTGDILDNSNTNTDNIRGMRTIFNAHIHPTPAGNSGSPTTEQ